jgi:hypothetical protein
MGPLHGGSLAGGIPTTAFTRFRGRLNQGSSRRSSKAHSRTIRCRPTSVQSLSRLKIASGIAPITVITGHQNQGV